MDRLQKNRIKEEICQCLFKISNLPALCADQIPEMMSKYWGIDIEEVIDPKVLMGLTLLARKKEEQVKERQELYPEEIVSYDYGRSSEEEIKKILLGGKKWQAREQEG